jgi:hypothetical protein
LRRDIRKAYSAGEFTVLSGYGVFVEGFDEPCTDGIVWARPTRSRAVVTQAIGRGLRPTFGKLDCLVLDLAAKDTKAIEAGTLTGKMLRCKQCGVQFFFGFNACPACGWIVVKEKKEAPKERSMISVAPVLMEGLHAKEVSLFDQLHGAWYRKDDYLSVGCGRDRGALIVAPPTWADVERQRERLIKAESLLATADEALKYKLIVNIERLQREIDRSEKYSLYFVPSILRDENKKPLPDIHQGKIEYLRANSDLGSLIAEADIEAIHRGGKQSMVEGINGYTGSGQLSENSARQGYS